MINFDTAANGATQLSENILKCLDYYLTRHFPSGKAIHSAALGTCPYADFLRAGSEFKSINHDSPVSGGATVDILYLGGPHGFLQTTRALGVAIELLSDRGVLVLPELDIPSNRHCYDFLKEEQDFSLHFTMENTAFFGIHRSARTTVRTWQDERYNVSHHPAFDHLAYRLPARLPFRLDYDGASSRCGSELVSGFMARSGRILSNGHVSTLAFDMGRGTTGAFNIDLTVRAFNISARPRAGLEVTIGGATPDRVDFTSADPVTLSGTTAADANGRIYIRLRHHSLVSGGSLSEPDIELPASSTPNIELLSVAIRAADDREPARPLTRHDGTVVSFDHQGETFRFFVNDPHDSVQAHHFAGEFYELAELELIAAHLPPGARILDVGANLANHTVYFERLMGAVRVVPIELQPRVIPLLRLNTALNGLRATDLSFLGVGLGAEDQAAQIRIPQAFNVAGAQFHSGAAGRFQIRRGDDLLRGQDFDFVKIDVEGMECDVISGLSETIRRCRPLIFAEVWEENRPRFDALGDELGYEVVSEYRRYDVATNLLLRCRNAG